jgi:hypothetical protein
MAEETTGLAGILSRLSTDRLRELADATDVELEKRGGGKKPSEMSDREFHAFVEKQLSKTTNSKDNRK